jgi:hypothetical protein
MIIEDDNGNTLNTRHAPFKGDKMKQYTVIWTIELDAVSFEDAARKALTIQRDSESIANVFDVSDGKTSEQIDIKELGSTED